MTTISKVKSNDRYLLEEAARRMLEFKHDIDSKFLGLGYPSEYKSEYFTVSFPPEQQRCLNWYRLTNKGKQYFKYQN